MDLIGGYSDDQEDEFVQNTELEIELEQTNGSLSRNEIVDEKIESKKDSNETIEDYCSDNKIPISHQVINILLSYF